MQRRQQVSYIKLCCTLLTEGMDISKFVSLVALGTIIYIAYKVVESILWMRIINKIPGPKPLPLIGNILDFHGPPETIFKIQRKRDKEYAPIYKIVSGLVGAVFISLPEDIEIVISSTKHNDKSKAYLPFQNWLQTGLLTSSGDKWHYRRKLLTPTFHFNILQQFTRTFIENTDKTLQEIGDLIDKIVDVEPLVTKFTFHTICETAMGANADNWDWNKYRNAVLRMGLIAIHRVFRPWYYIQLTYIFSPKFYEGFFTCRLLHKYSRNIIVERRKTFDPDNVESSIFNDSDDVVYKSRKRLAMLDMLLYAQSRGADIDEEGIREEVDTFVFEGHDTTSSCLCFALMLLACNRDVQDKALIEIRQLLPNKTDKVTFDILNKMRYLERVIKESLRLYPSVPQFGRRLSETVMTHTGYELPTGTDVLIRVIDLHRNPAIYPDPERFDPDRFLPEKIRERHHFAYLPFSAGPRNCIGQKFALLELKAFLSGILRNFELVPVDTPATITLVSGLILHSRDGIRLKFIRR